MIMFVKMAENAKFLYGNGSAAFADLYGLFIYC